MTQQLPQRKANVDLLDGGFYANNHLAFGFGTHFCLGNQLARLELSMKTKRLLQRLPTCA